MAIISYQPVLDGKQPFSGPGLVRRDFNVTSTGSTFAITVANATLTGMSGVVAIYPMCIGTLSSEIRTTNTASGDGIDFSTGTLTLVQSETRACAWHITILSRT